MSGPVHSTDANRWSGLGLALVLSILLMIASAAKFLGSMLFMLERHHILKGFEFLPLVMSPVGPRVAGLAAYIVLAHLVFGVLVWLVATSWHRLRRFRGVPLRTLILGAWLLWSAALMLANAGLSEWSASAVGFREVADLPIGPLELWRWVLVLALLTLWPVATRILIAVREPGRARVAATAAGVLMLTAFGADTLSSALRSETDAGRGSQPNLIIIGVDSLHLPWVGAFGGDLTPNIDAFVDQSVLFPWSFSPLARTFPSWVSLLSGRMPRSTGVRDNMAPLETYADLRTLPDVLREHGYKTAFAMDEVRFGYIDESLGFDQVISPPIGAHDFLLASIADMPMTNVMVNTFVGRYLVPTLYANRAAGVSYEPRSFDRLIWDELKGDGKPLFLATHFTLAHHPIFWASAPRTYEYLRRPDVDDRLLMREQAYRAAAREVDAQVGRFLAEAGRRGLLDNAVVVLMSDHGEALGLPEDDGLGILLAPPGVRGVHFRTSLSGHGNSVTSPHQFETLLAVRRFGGTERWQGRRNLHTSLIDIGPTLFGLAGLPPLADSLPGLEGADLSAVVRGEPASPSLRRRILFTETGYVPASIDKDLPINERQVFLEGIQFHQMNSILGRIEFRPDRQQEIVARKQRAAIAPPWVLAAVPYRDLGQTLWMLYNIRTRQWVRYPQDLALMPGNPPAGLMEDALRAHFGAELPPAEPWPDSIVAYDEPRPSAVPD